MFPEDGSEIANFNKLKKIPKKYFKLLTFMQKVYNFNIDNHIILESQKVENKDQLTKLVEKEYNVLLSDE